MRATDAAPPELETCLRRRSINIALLRSCNAIFLISRYYSRRLQRFGLAPIGNLTSVRFNLPPARARVVFDLRHSEADRQNFGGGAIWVSRTMYLSAMRTLTTKRWPPARTDGSACCMTG